MNSYSGEYLQRLGERIKSELLHDPRPSLGRSTLVIALIFVLIWLFLHYTIGLSWSTGRFMPVAICFGLWGMADVLPRRLRGIAAVLRAGGWIFLFALAAWVVIDLITG